MNNNSNSADLNEEITQLKEKVYKEDVKKRNIWVVDVDLRKHYDITFMEAALFGMITQLQCVKKGFCWAKNYYFLDALGISDEWLRLSIKKLSDKGLVWFHVYNTRNGKRRHIVTSSSIRSYQAYLYKHSSWNLLRKFQREFVIIHAPEIPPDLAPPKGEKDTQVTDTIPPPEKSHRPNGKSGDGPPQDSQLATKTTSFYYNQNDVTCKGSDDPSAAAFSEDEMRKELEHSFSKKQIDHGFEWYKYQSKAKRSEMKKPIACIVDAIKRGYAKEEVDSANKEVAAQLQQKERVRINRFEKKSEVCTNRKNAEKIIEKFSHLKGWNHNLDSKGFSINNLGVEKGKDTENGYSLAYYILPDGKKCYGKNHFLRVTFDLPTTEFNKQIREFFNEAEWKTKPERKMA